MSDNEDTSTDDPVESGALEDETGEPEGEGEGEETLQDEQQGKGYGAG